MNGGKGGLERSGGAFIGAERKPLRQRGAKPPARASQRDSALDAHASTSERGNEEAIRAAEAMRITAQDSGG